MKLLLDENLSRRILPALALRLPGSSHVAVEGLSTASDEEVWAWAGANDLVIVTKDDDFQTLSDLRGHPRASFASPWATAQMNKCWKC